MPYPLIASIIVASCSLVGILFFRNSGRLSGAHRFILPLAVGVFLGIVFFELVPETLEGSPSFGPLAILAGFFTFYYIAHLLTTYHHHHHDHQDGCTSGGARMLLIGDAIHNVADGVVITSAFLIDPILGIVTTIGVILHELPQEIAEFGVLIASGYSRTRALTLNFISALSIVVGTLITLMFASYIGEYIWILTGIAAGNLLYIATSDLIPELRQSHRDHFYKIFSAALLGVAFIALSLSLAHTFTESHGVEHEHGDEHSEHTDLH